MVAIPRVAQRTLDGDTVIERGDFLWCDFGLIAMGLWTDTQHQVEQMPTVLSYDGPDHLGLY